MQSKDELYWSKRQEQKFKTAEKQIDEYYRSLTKSFEKAQKGIHSTINNFYIRYAENNELTYDAAMIELNFKELQNLKDDLEEFRQLALSSIGEFNLDLENMSMKARITRYQALEMQIDSILNNLYAIDYEKVGKEKLAELYKDQYYRTIFNIEQYAGFHSGFAQVNTRAVEELLRYPFNGANYSDRLWRQKDDMLHKLKSDINSMLVMGTHPSELADDFAKTFKVKQFEAYRLLHTEGAFITEQATIHGYKEDRVEYYKILATLDIKTSEICQEQDSNVYRVDEAVTGKNLPPFHMFCRTTTVPYFEDADTWIDKRVARNPLTNKSKTVPANMSYSEWYKEYVSSNLGAIAEERKIKNRASDKKQYEKYKEVLGKDTPKSFDKFQELKYNNVNEWNITKGNYRKIKYYNSVVENEPEITNDLLSISKNTSTDLVGLEYRLKTKDSYLRKVNSDSQSSLDINIIDNVISNTNDIIRYTYQDTSYKLVDSYNNINGELEKLGYNQVKFKNTWLDKRSAYKGVNCIFKHPNGQKFEVQFHTQESFNLKNGDLHKMYEEFRLDTTSDERRIELNNEMFDLSSKLEKPKNIEKLIRRD